MPALSSDEGDAACVNARLTLPCDECQPLLYILRIVVIRLLQAFLFVIKVIVTEYRPQTISHR